jgi:hypothetical protein
MVKADAVEATPLLQRSLRNLLMAVPSQGVPSAAFRTACGWFSANAEILLLQDAWGPQLQLCFSLAQQVGGTQQQIDWVRVQAMAEAPATLGGKLAQNSVIRMCLATEGTIIAGMTFVSRDDVDALLAEMNLAFNAAEEVAADDMDQMTYRALVALHGGVSYFLTESARPLPRMVSFQFARVMPSLVMANRLYPSETKPGAARADELVAENNIVHPAFMQPTGRALSQ